MDKLTAKRLRDRDRADSARVTAEAQAIALTFPPGVAPVAIEEFIQRAKTAIENYLVSLPQPGKSESPRREHRATTEQRYPASAHRPPDAVRHALIGDLYDSYMSARGDDPDSRGFKRTVDVVLNAAGLPPVSEHEQTSIRDRIKEFAKLAGNAPEGK